MRRTYRDSDSDVRMFSRAAWHRLFAQCVCPPSAQIARPDIPDFRAWLQERDARWSPPISGVESILAALADPDHPEARRRAIERCRPFLAESRALCDALVGMLNDSAAEVRVSAAVWLSEAPSTPERLAALLRTALSTDRAEVRAAALFAIGTFGPRAEGLVSSILDLLSQIHDPMMDPTAFYAAEALESIGAVALRRIVSNILTGRVERTERWFSSLALRPDLADRIVEEITRQVQPEETWLMSRVQRAVSVLRPGDR